MPPSWPKPEVLDAAERRLGQGDAEVVDGHHAMVERVGDLGGRLGVLGEGVARQAEWQLVGAGQHVVGLLEAQHHGDRAERLLVHDAGVLGHVRQHGRLEEVALVADALAAGRHLRTLVLRVGHERLDGVDAARVGQRTHAAVGFHAVTHLGLVGDVDELADELVVDLVVHEEAGRRHAHLAGVAVLEGAHQLGGALHVGVVEHQHGSVTAELHGGALHVACRQRVQVLADRDRAGERHLADDRARNEVLRDLRRHAVHEIDHARGYAGIVEALDEADRRARRLLGALDDDRAARRQRRRDLAHRLRDREVPGRKAGDRADRLQDHHVAHAVGAGRNDAAVGALPLAGEPLDDVGGALHLERRLRQDLALLQGQHLGDFRGAGAHQVGGLAQDLAALEGRHFPPGLEALVDGGQRLVEVALGGEAQLADRRVLGRVHDFLGLGAGRLDPVAVDVVLERCIRHVLHPLPVTCENWVWGNNDRWTRPRKRFVRQRPYPGTPAMHILIVTTNRLCEGRHRPPRPC